MLRRTVLAALGAFGLAAATFAPVAMAQQDQQIDRISDYLNSLDTLKGDFVQIEADGLISEGEFFMRRPGRLLFRYTRPDRRSVISDGFWVAVVDTRENSIDRFPLSETPLKLLLAEDVDLGAEKAITKVEESRGQLRVTAVDPGNEAQGSITMVFDANPLALKQWITVDGQGLKTTIALRGVSSNVELENELFRIPRREGDFRD
ncbi:MAG: outer membrane lipoprotein carrier protein LolA [Pseudomonadota bacterium]